MPPFSSRPALALLALLCATPLYAQDPEAPPAETAPHDLNASQALLGDPLDMAALRESLNTQAIATPLSEEIGVYLDATIAQAIAATGSFTGFEAVNWLTTAKEGQSRTIVVNAYSQRRGAMFPDPGVQIAQLGKQSFGSPDLLAIGVEQKFADSRTMATQVRLRHASGPIDVQVNLNGAKPLASANPMQLSYNSSAIYHVNSVLELGMIARGSLGSLGDFSPYDRQHDAGALARLKLLGKDRVFSAETGYDKKLGPGTENLPGQFHMNLNFNWKL